MDNVATPADGYAQSFQALGMSGDVAAVLVFVFANPDRDRKLIRG